MHFRLLKGARFKAFGGEYLMIVISILTALAIEQGAEAIHHHSEAKEASEKIDAEIRANIDDIAKVRAHNRAEGNKVLKVRNAFLGDIKSGVSDEALKKRLDNEYKDAFSISVHTPTLRREAWEVAVANQSVSWMSAEKLKRYSVIYAQMRDLQSINISGSNSFLDGPRMLDTMSDAQMGTADPRQVFRMMNQIISSYRGINDNLKALQEQMETSAPKAGAAK